MSEVVTRIVDLTPGMQGLSLQFIVLEISSPTITKSKREVRSVRIADETGSVNMSVWDYLGKMLVPGEIIRMQSGYSSVWKQRLTVYLGKRGTLRQMGDFSTKPVIYTDTPNMSRVIPGYEGKNFGGKRRKWSRRHYNIVPITLVAPVRPGMSLFTPEPIRILREEESSALAIPGRSIDSPIPIRPLRPLPSAANRRPQLTATPISRPTAIAAANAVVSPAAMGRALTSEARPAEAALGVIPVMPVAPIVRHVAPARQEAHPEPLVDHFRPYRQGRGH